MIEKATGNKRKDTLLHTRWLVFYSIKQSGFVDYDKYIKQSSISKTQVQNAVAYLRNNGVIEFTGFSRVDGKYNCSMYSIKDEYIVDYSKPNCSSCGGEIKKRKTAKYLDLCNDCTAIKFMSKKKHICSSCNKTVVNGEYRKRHKLIVCIACIDTIKKANQIKKQSEELKKIKRLPCLSCGQSCLCSVSSQYCSSCISIFNCFCGKNQNKTNAVRYKKMLFCSKECVLEYKIKSTNKFSANVIKMFKRECAFCGYNTIVHYHHILERVNGGDSSFDNCVPLCPNHHEEYHRGFKTKDQIIEARKRVVLDTF